jgi:hypothetical protein
MMSRKGIPFGLLFWEESKTMISTKIYVGLNDSVTKTQLFETEMYIKILKDVCRSYRIPFSFGVEEGGYVHADGEYTREMTLVITLIDIDRSIINEIAKDLCAFFNQESVLIVENTVRAYYVSDSVRECAEKQEP